MLAIIPARGGSKGLPGKNIRKLNGIPLIGYAIKAALESSFISKVYVSTDDEEIREVALGLGAECTELRPDCLATDTAAAVDTYIHTLDLLEKSGFSFEEVVILQPTSPLRSSEDIDGAVNLYYEKKADSVISYCIDEKPIFWSKYLNHDLTFENIFPDNIDNRQSLKDTYHPNGAIFIIKSSLIRQKNYYSDKSYAYIMPRERSVDIDTIDDFEYAEFLIKRK